MIYCNNKLYFFCLLLFFITTRVNYAGHITSVCDGNWSDSTVWNYGVPTSSDSVSIYHNVILDVSVYLTLPATLYIVASGDLCGYETLQCEFIADGPLSVGTLITLGNSVSNVFVQSAYSTTINGSWQMNGGACVGCAFSCSPILNPCTSPTADFNSNDTVICEGSCISFTDLSNGYPSYWQWSFPGGIPATTSLQNPNSICYASPGVYYATLIVSNVNGADSVTKTIVVNPLPVTDFTADSVCTGNPTQFTDQSYIVTGSIISWIWDFGDGVGSSILNNPVYTYSNSGIYSVALEIMSDDGCSGYVTLPVEVFPLPSPEFSFTNVCLNDTAVFTDMSAISSGTINLWQWNFGDSSSFQYSQNPVHHFFKDSIYYVNLVAYSDMGCWDSIIKPVQIYPSPYADASNDTTICLGDTITINATGGATYNWNPIIGLNNPNISNPAANPTVTTTYSIEVTNMYGCSDFDSVTITVYSLPSITGKVYDSIFLVASGIVKLREYDNNPTQMLDIDSSVIDINGNYTFSNVPQGLYLVIARADTAIYPNLVATYYGSTNHWQNAAIINPKCSDTIIADIHLISFPATIGHGSVSGTVHGSGTNKTEGYDYPLAGIDIYLEKIDFPGIAGYCITDTSGYYSFNNVPMGRYIIYLDITGLVMDTTYNIFVTETDSVFKNLDFCVDSTIINICSLNGIGYGNSVPMYISSIFPNPFTGKTNILLKLENKTEVTVEIINIFGVTIQTLFNGVKDRGEYYYSFTERDSGVSSGIYLLKLIINGKVYITKIVQL